MIKTEDDLIRSAKFTYFYQVAFAPYITGAMLYLVMFALPIFFFWKPVSTTIFAKAFEGLMSGFLVIIAVGMCTEVYTKYNQSIDWIEGIFCELRREYKQKHKSTYSMQRYKNFMYDLRMRSIRVVNSKKEVLTRALFYFASYNFIFVAVRLLTR